MGKNDLRKYLYEEQRWSDKTAPKHKHNYIIEVNVEVAQPNGVFYFHAMKCEFCNTFKCIPEEGAITGYIKKPIENIPTLKLYKSHRTLSFKGAILREPCD